MRDGIGQNRYLDEFVADLPRENVGILAPIVVDLLLDVVGGHLGLGSANDTRPDASGSGSWTRIRATPATVAK